MKKKFLYVILTLVFAVALGGGSVAVLSTANALNASGAVVTEGESDVTTTTAENITAWTVANSTNVKNVTGITNVNGGKYKLYNYTGGIQGVTLPAGTYCFEAWGASGGDDGQYKGGAGGYTRAIVTLTAEKAIYIGIGGAGGTGANGAAGYNGGGKAGPNGTSGGGGGATHIAHSTNRGALTGYASYTGEVIMAAGGGGGAGNTYTYGNFGHKAGYGGRAPHPACNTNNTTAINYNTGGTVFGRGTDRGTAGNGDGGGGAGGWYGGKGAACDGNGGGGFSNVNGVNASNVRVESSYGGVAVNTDAYRYINGNANMPHPTSYGNTTYNQKTSLIRANGYARITALNTPPTTRNATIAGVNRGASAAATVPGTLAQDTDSFYKDLLWVDSNAVFTDAACTKRADQGADNVKYFTVSGMTAGAKGGMVLKPTRYFTSTTFYVRIKDNGGMQSVISFKFSSTDRDIQPKSGTFGDVTNGYGYRVGTGSATADPKTGIYNPAGAVHTVIIPKPITYNANAVYINAADLFSDADATTYDQVLITSVVNPTSSSYKVVTPADSYALTKGYTRVKIEHVAAATSTNYINTVTLRVRAVEKSTKTLMGTEKTVNVVFKIDNTRPNFNTDYHFISSVGAGTTAVNLSQFLADPDGNRMEIKEVKVPTNEYIYVDSYNKVRTIRTASAYANFNNANGNNIVASGVLSKDSGMGSKRLYFEPNSIKEATADTSEAYVSYTISADGQTLNLTPLRATRSQFITNDSATTEANRTFGHFYFLVRVEDKGEPSDKGVWYPIAVTINNTQPTQPTAVAVADSSTVTEVDSDGNKVMYFSPMGIGALDSKDFKNDAGMVKGVAEDRDSYSVFLDNISSESNRVSTSMYNEFLLFDKSQFGSQNKIETEFYRIEPVNLYASAVTAAKIGKNKHITGTTSDLGWERYDEWGSDIQFVGGSTETILFYGIKVTFLRSTRGNYIQQPIMVKDTRGETNSVTGGENTGSLNGIINLLIKVENHAVTALDGDSVKATDGKITGARNEPENYGGSNALEDGIVKVDYNGGIVSYSIPSGYDFDITPYDLAKDIDMAAGWVVGNNTNPNKGRESLTSVIDKNDRYTAQLAQAGKDLMYHYTTDLLTLSTAKQAVKLNELIFDGDPQVSNVSGGELQLASDGNRLTVKTRSRTAQSNPMAFTVKISDGEGSSVNVEVRVHVTDNLPFLSEAATNVFYLSSNFNGLNAETTNSSNDYSGDLYDPTHSLGENALFKTGYNVREFRANDLASDYEDANLYFANTDRKFFTKNAAGELVPIVGDDYVEAMFTLATGGRSGQVLRVTAKSCTQQLEYGLFIQVYITDNYGFDATANFSAITFQIEVVNSLPQVNIDADTGFGVETKEDDGSGNASVTYKWEYSPDDSSDITNAKYIVSDPALYNHLTTRSTAPVSAKNVKLLSSDNDTRDGLLLYPGKYATGENSVPLYAVDTEGGTNGTAQNNVAVLYTAPRAYIDPITLVDILYFDASYNELPSAYNHGTKDVFIAHFDEDRDAKDYVDNPRWAIRITSTVSFTTPMQMTVRVRDTSDTQKSTETGYDGKRDGSTKDIIGSTELKFAVNIGSTGMTVTHSVYNGVSKDPAMGGEWTDKYYIKEIDETTKDAKYNYTEFRYNGINISSAAEVPLSYFAFSQSLPTDAGLASTYGSVVSFNGAFIKKYVSMSTSSMPKEIAERISLTDGVTVWSGATLNDNPFVELSVKWSENTSDIGYNRNDGYLNNLIASSAFEGPSGIVHSHTVGENVLHENKQSIRIVKKGPRNGTSPLKLTLDLALYSDWKSTDPEISGGENPITAKVTVDLSIKNESLQIDGSSNKKVEFSTGSVIPQELISSYTFRLVDRNLSGSPATSDVLSISYQDDNRLQDGESDYGKTYRDSAKFMFNSLGSTSGVAILTQDQLRYMIDRDNNSLAHTGTGNAIEDLAAYLGIDAVDSGKTMAQTIYDKDDAYLAAVEPNKGYERYFSIADGFDSDSFSITPKRKTTIDISGLTDAEIETKAAQNNLAFEKTNGKYSFYFPLKVIVYDTYGGTDFMSSSWQLLTIKVYVNNSTPSVNPSLYSSGSSFNVAVTLQDDYTMRIVDTVKDNDFVLSEDGSNYLTEDQIKALTDVDTLDWLICGDKYEDILNSGDGIKMGYGNYPANYVHSSNSYEIGSTMYKEADRLVDVTIDGTTIKFHANKKSPAYSYVLIRFSDNRGDYVDFRVLVHVNNKAPELLKRPNTNTVLYDSSKLEIKMKTGDSFDLIVTPYDYFYNDLTTEQQNNFKSHIQNPDTNSFGPNTAYANLVDGSGDPKFINDSTGAQYAGKETYLGAFAVAQDDTPSSLYFRDFDESSTNRRIDVARTNEYNYGHNPTPLTYHIVAKGVCSRMPLRFTVTDGSLTLTITLIITVESTPPQLLPDGSSLPEGVASVPRVEVPDGDYDTVASNEGVTADELREGRVYKVDMTLDSPPRTIDLRALCYDPDAGETSNMYLYRAFSGSAFSIGGNETGVNESTYVSLKENVDTSTGKARSFTITPLNFLSGENNSRKFEQIVFYVMDASGQSLADAQKIILNVYIAPGNVSNAAATGQNPTVVSYEVKSKDDFAADAMPSALELIARSATAQNARGRIIDPDYGASRTSYAVTVYGMLTTTVGEDGTITTAPIAPKDFPSHMEDKTDPSALFTRYEIKRYVSTADGMLVESANGENPALCEYVGRYFTFDFSADGSKLNFQPLDTTLNVRIPLCVKVTKLGVGKDVTSSAYAFFNITVKNSAPIAVQEDLSNDTYFGDGSTFLNFVGGVGAKRRYYLHDGKSVEINGEMQEQAGLFSDSDTNDSVVFATTAGEKRGWSVRPTYEEDGKTVTTSPWWDANAIKGIGPAFTIESALNGAAVDITINRKVDAGEVSGVDGMKIPVEIFGVDSQGAVSSTVIMLDIQNSAPTVKEVTKDDGKGFTITYNAETERYIFEMSIEGGTSKTVLLSDIYDDPDISQSVTGNCDVTEFFGDASNGYLSDISSKPYSTHDVYSQGSLAQRKLLFKVKSSMDMRNSSLSIECVSYERGSVGVALLQIRDSAKRETKVIEMRFTVANSAPVAVEQSLRRIDIPGSGGVENAGSSLDAVPFNILDYVTDANPGDYQEYLAGGTNSSTYLRISSISLLPISSEDKENGEIWQGPSGDSTIEDLFMAGISDDNPQQFFIIPMSGYYGWQMFRVYVLDDGGNIYATDVGAPVPVDLRVFIARDHSDQVGNTVSIVRGRDEPIDISDILDKKDDNGVVIGNFSGGYTLNDIQIPEAADKKLAKTVTTGNTNNTIFRLKATAKEPQTVDVNAVCSIGTMVSDITIPFKVSIEENLKPVLLDEFKNVNNPFNFDESKEKDGFIRVSPDEIFKDPDQPIGKMVMKFRSVSSNMNSVCKATVDMDTNELLLQFKANRPVELTIVVWDETEEDKRETITVQCITKPNLNFVSSAIIFISRNPLAFSVGFGLLLLLILILLIIIIVVKKKRKMRKEIEALLVSEMEMEEQMLKLSSGNSAGVNPYYQSFGYMPPTQQTPNAPMLGQGGPMPGATPPAPPTSGAIGLNPGGDANKNDGNGDGFGGF